MLNPFPRITALVFAGLMAVPAAVQAQGDASKWPTKPVRFIIPFAAGASSDVLGRLVADQLSKALGQPFVVENKTGASGIVGTQAALKEPADGYTILVVGSSPMVFNQLVFQKLPYDPNDLLPVTVIANYPLVIAAHPDTPAKTLADMVRIAKEKPGYYTYSNTSVTFVAQMEYLNSILGIKMTQVMYKGGGPALTAVLGGQTHFIAQDPTSVASQHKAGKLRAIAVTTKERNSAMPDVPTVAETVPNFETGVFMGLAVHRNTPGAIVQKLWQETAKAIRLPAVHDRIVQYGMEPQGTSPEESAARRKRELEMYAPIVEAAGLRATQ
jgi:tripartite-type tricarboxylate transporter receptor subunit TctC